MLSEFEHGVQEPVLPPIATPTRASATPESLVPLISLNQVSKSFPLAVGEYRALEDVNLELPARRLIAITGSSGSGKSTLLNLIAGLDRPSSGSIVVAGTQLSTLNESELATFRGAKIGVVFQFFQLLPTLTALENILLAMDLVKVIEPSQRRARALSLLARVEVADQADKFPAALSGGQQQRVAIARALANDPPLLVADEPTGNLDSHAAHAVFGLLKELATAGKTVLVVTHEREYPVSVDGIIELRDGRIVRKVDGPSIQQTRTAPCTG